MSDVREFRRDTSAHLADHQRARLLRDEERQLHEFIAKAAREKEPLPPRRLVSGWIVILTLGFWIGFVLAGWLL